MVAGRERVRHRENDEPAHPVRDEHRGEPRHGRTPVVPDDVRRLDAQLVEDAGHVRDDVRQRVGRDLVRALGLTEAAQVRHDHPEAVVHQVRDLMAPQVAGVGPAVQEQHRHARAMLCHIQRDAVDLQQLSLRCAHAGGRPPLPRWPPGRSGRVLIVQDAQHLGAGRAGNDDSS